MRILWVKMGGLWPSTTGGRVRSLQIVSALSRHHRVTLVTTHGPGDDPEGLARQLPDCQQVVSIPYDVPKRGSSAFPLTLARSWFSSYPVDLWKWRVAEVRERVQALVEKDRIDVVRLRLPVRRRERAARRDGVPVVLFEHNVEYPDLEAAQRARAQSDQEAAVRDRVAQAPQQGSRAVPPRRPDDRRVGGRSRAPCRHGARRQEPARSRRESTRRISLRPDVRKFRRALSSADRWTGIRMRMRSSISANRFCRRSASRCRARRSRSSGAIPLRSFATLPQRLGMIVTGTVDDVRPYLDEAAVYVVPLRAGSGTRMKIFEALGMAKPVVSTTVGAEGLALTDQKEFIAADDPAGFRCSGGPPLAQRTATKRTRPGRTGARG